MALAMVTSLVATPKVALPNKSAKKTRTELTLPAVQKQQPQVKHVAKKHVVRKAVSRKAAMASSELYKVNFTATQGGWTIQDKELSGLSCVWKRDAQYGMKANAYNKQAYAAESWLISPAIDLTSATEATLKLNQAVNKGAATNLKVKVSVDNGVNWSDLSINMPAGTSWDYQEDEADLADYVGSSIKLAFAYVSTTTVSPTWQIKDLVITGDGGTPVPPTPPTPGDIYTIAEVKSLQAAGTIQDDDIISVKGYVAGMFLKPSNFEKYGSVCVWLTDTKGGSAKELELYNCFGLNEDKFTSFSPDATGDKNVDVTTVSTETYSLNVGDYVEATGAFKLFNTTYELNTGCYLTKIGSDTPTPPTPGDTIPLTSLDGLDIAYYGSYSEEGAYNYTLVLYNSQDESYVPQVGFDLYTEVKDEFTGDFTAEDGNLGLDYSAFYPTADSEGEYFTDASVSITKGEGNNLVVEGIFTTEAGKTYTFSVTAEPYIYDGDHPYEPQEAKTFNLTAIGGEVDDSYFADYGIVYYYLDMEDGSYVGLTYRTSKGTQPEGTFAISDEEGADAFLTGMDYNSEPDGSFYETIDDYVYYFVSGSVTLTTDEDGNITITINATSVYGSTFTVTGVISNQPSGDPIIISDDYLRLNDNVKKFMYNGNVMINVNGVIYNVMGAKVAR